MTVGRRILIGRSLAALNDRHSIEDWPIDQVLADLDALGLSPNASISAARKLALKHSSPARRLLVKLDDGEAIDSEIDALEHAGIDDVQSRISSGIAATVAAKAKRQSGQPTNIHALKRPSRRFWGWGGSLIGMAACLLLFIVTRPDQFYQREHPVEQSIDAVGVTSESVTIEEADLAETARLTMKRFKRAEVQGSDANLAPTIAAKRQETPRSAKASPSVSADEQSRTLEATEGQETAIVAAPAQRPSDQLLSEQATAALAQLPSHQPQPKPLTKDDNSSDEQELKPDQKPMATATLPMTSLDSLNSGSPTAFAGNLGAIQNSLVDLADDIPDPAQLLDHQSGLRAVLIVDEKAAPHDLKLKAKVLPKGDLIDRLEEARAHLGDRPILALVTRLRDGNEVNSIVTTKKYQANIRVEKAVIGRASSAQHSQDMFELIDLPTIR